MIYLDVHGDTSSIAIKRICKRASQLFKLNGVASFCVIHGYNNGTSLLKIIRKFDFKCRYIAKIYPDPINKGRSIVYIRR